MSSVADIVELKDERTKRAPLAEHEFKSAGAMLKAAREASGLSERDIEDAINIRPDYISAIEEMDIDKLPVAAYTSGFVKAYADYLKLPSDLLLSRFRKEAGYETSHLAPEIAPKPQYEISGGRELSLLAVIGIVFFILWVIFQISKPPRDAGPVVATPVAPMQTLPVSEPSETVTVQNDLPSQALATASEASTADEAMIDNRATENSTATEATESTQALDIAISQASDTTIVDPDENVEPELSVEEILTGEIEETSFVSEADNLIEQQLLSNPAESEVENFVEEDSPIFDIPLETSQPEELAPSSNAIFEAAPVISDPSTEDGSTGVNSVEANFIAATRLSTVAPVYPNRCQRRAGDVESVTVAFDISRDGRPVNARIASSTNGCFERAALSAVSRWQYTPATRGGVAVTAFGQTADFSFKLPE